ncbi:MAG: UDP-N-acetylmuramoyl-L-alanine--D-glutamate ligase [Desulfovibrio sp.]|jgi:UDP-N-acetylmuramoylalanine--D-glutamate ligase|nr:UDP-N-acetylmuramoyl-L-alanine--D-glutamate ligase [Desulfovibrio sp.]
MTKPGVTDSFDTAVRRAPSILPGREAPIAPGATAVVVGAGLSGFAAARLLAAWGARVRLLERNADPGQEVMERAREAGFELLLGEHTPEQFRGASLVVVSPGVPPATLAPLRAAAGNPPLIGETELALRCVREPVSAVTGTSGKTTTVSLAAAMLRAAGKKVFLGGNIGVPLSEYALSGETVDVLVLELSSFQLQCMFSLRPRAAVLLNLAANHLDHHADMAEYSAAKFSIFARQEGDDLAVVPEDLAEEYRRRGYKGRLKIFRASGRFPMGRLIGAHNAADAEAAYLAAAEFGVSETDAARAVAAFTPLPHRLEKVGKLDGVSYVNDSKSTTVDALRAALLSFDAPLLLLAGGHFKGGDLESLRPLLSAKVKAVALFGASREVFEKAWRGTVPLTWDPELPAALRRLRAAARAGDVVLLSPATASYDLYGSYKERGDHLRRLVAAAVAGEEIL